MGSVSIFAKGENPHREAADGCSRRHPFALGDRVICVRGGSIAGWFSKLVEGETYVIVETSDNGWMQGVNLDDPRLAPGVPHYSVSRFRKATGAA